MYKAIITIKDPDDQDANELEITLMPSDEIVFADGRVKALQDCTLAELQMIAEMFEAEFQRDLRDATLFDLMIDGVATVRVDAVEDGAVEPPMFEFWLDQYVMLPEPADHEGYKDEDEDGTQTGDAKTTETDETVDSSAQLPDDQDTPLDETADDSQEQEAVTEPLPGQETVEQQDSEGILPASEVRLTEPEPLVEEDEAATRGEAESVEEDTTAVDEKPSDHVYVPDLTYVRILGKRRPLNHPTWTAIDILMNEPAFRDAQAHAISSPDREVAGVLVGPQPEKQPDGRYVVHISDTIIAKHTRMHGASVTYTPESWRYVNDVINERYPGESAVIVGWYHTHPGFGIFLSSMDQFIHYNFFTQLWHIALVLDPVNRKSGFFCWDRHHKNVDRYQFPWPEWAKGSW